MSRSSKYIHIFLLLIGFLYLTYCPIPAMGDETHIDAPLVFVQVPVNARPDPMPGGAYLPFSRYVDGCRIVSLAWADENPEPRVLTPEFLSARDPSVSFDGRHILFTGKRNAGDPWQIWRMDPDGGQKVKITTGAGSCVNPIYVGTDFHLDDKVPTPRIVYVGTGHNWALGGSSDPSTGLYACNLDGGNAVRITYNLLPDFDPDVLPNGRLVYSSWRPHGLITGLAGKIVLLAVNIDGTDQMAYGEESEETFHAEMARADSKGVYFIENRHRDWLGGGNLAYISQRRPLHSRKVLADRSTGLYHSPCPWSDDKLILSFKLPIRKATYGIYLFDAGIKNLEKEIYSVTEYHCVDARILAPHPMVRGRSSVVGFRFKDSGSFYCLDARISDLPEVRKLEPGTIKRVRVIEGVPLTGPDRGGAFGGYASLPPGSIRSHAVERILGEAPVESDGSFHMRTPANVPLRFQLLDEQGIALAEQVTWSWVRNGEGRGCIGCHENREMVPPNVMAEAIAKPEVPLETPVDDRRTVDFSHDVFPIISEKCMKCHTPGVADPALGMIDRVYLSMFSGREPFASPGQAGRSPLVRRVLKETRSENGDMTPCAQAATDSDRKTLIEWIDLGCWYDTRTGLNSAPPTTSQQGGN